MKRAPNNAGYVHSTGYRRVHRTDRVIAEHIEMAERAIGKPLPPGVEVHHVNEIKSDNRPWNLVVCPDRAYHQLLHVRTAALDACGNADWRRCAYCRVHDDLMRLGYDKFRHFHPACRRAYQQRGRDRRRVSHVNS